MLGIKSYWKPMLVSLFSAFVILLICSKSSYLYPINDWTDANIYLSMGRGITEGQLIYRDLYDHKGPILYFLHALCVLISSNGFIGVFWLEVITATLFLFISYKIILMLTSNEKAYVIIPILALIVFASRSFESGDSAEELCLPIMAFALMDGIGKCKGQTFTRNRLVLHGFLVGVVFLIKFTLLGAQAALCLWIVCSSLFTKQWNKAGKQVAYLLLGFILSLLPWLVYFTIYGAMGDFIQTYFIDNLFLYASSEQSMTIFMRFKEMIKSVLDWFKTNLMYTIPIGMGLIHFVVFKQRKIGLFITFAMVMAAGFVFIGGRSYPYYGLALAIFAPLGLAAIACWINEWIDSFSSHAMSFISVGVVIVCAVLALIASPNVRTSFMQRKEQTMQYQIAAAVDMENPSILNYGFMDAGFFTALGVAPHVKYFHQTNVPKEEMLSEQIRYIEDAEVDYVITRGKEPPVLYQNYTLVAKATPPDFFWYDEVFLYKRN